MFIEYNRVLMSVLPGALAKMDIPEEIIKKLHEHISLGIPPVEPAPNCPEDTEEMVLMGSFIPVRVSGFLKKDGFEDISPDIVASFLLNEMQDSDFIVEIGKGVFLNGLPTQEKVKRFLDQVLNDGFGSFRMGIKPGILSGENGGFLRDILVRKVESGSLDEIYRQFLCGDCSSNNDLLIPLTALVDPEFDYLPKLSNSSSLCQDNPLSMWALMRHVSNYFYCLRACKPEYSNLNLEADSILGDLPKTDLLTGVNDFVPDIMSLSPYQKTISNEMIKRALSEGRKLVLEFRFYYFQSLLRERPEVLWKPVMNFNRSVRTLWNDPWCRLALQGELYTSHRERASELCRIIAFIVRLWESYLVNPFWLVDKSNYK
ncbi:MAG TPA: hypothetical protein PKA63_00640 [Oligoflexia bacterium]|nr:hypothetical protein [Oligoflexia bacterium]HMP47157.1 hypothetical protein [Oligoflexia bacterium]